MRLKLETWRYIGNIMVAGALQAISLTKLGQDSVLNLPSCPLVCRLRTVLFHQDQLSLSACGHFWSVLTFGMCVSLIQSVLTFVLTLVLSLGQVGGTSGRLSQVRVYWLIMLILTLERLSLCSEIHDDNKDWSLRGLIAVLAVMKIDFVMMFRLNILLN